MNNYIINDSGVVINPTIIFEYSNPKKFLAWDRYLIKVGKCKNDLWDFGYWTAGSCGPVSCGKYNSFEEAEIEAIRFLNNTFQELQNEDKIGSEACFKNAKSSFQAFLTQKVNHNNDLIKQLNINTCFQLSIF